MVTGFLSDFYEGKYKKSEVVKKSLPVGFKQEVLDSFIENHKTTYKVSNFESVGQYSSHDSKTYTDAEFQIDVIHINKDGKQAKYTDHIELCFADSKTSRGNISGVTGNLISLTDNIRSIESSFYARSSSSRPASEHVGGSVTIKGGEEGEKNKGLSEFITGWRIKHRLTESRIKGLKNYHFPAQGEVYFEMDSIVANFNHFDSKPKKPLAELITVKFSTYGELTPKIVISNQGVDVNENIVSPVSLYIMKHRETGATYELVGKNNKKSLYVQSVIPNGKAWRSGLWHGDKITHIDGIAIDASDKTENEWSFFINKAKHVTVNRGGVLFNLSFKPDNPSEHTPKRYMAVIGNVSVNRMKQLCSSPTVVLNSILKDLQKGDYASSLCARPDFLFKHIQIHTPSRRKVNDIDKLLTLDDKGTPKLEAKLPIYDQVKRAMIYELNNFHGAYIQAAIPHAEVSVKEVLTQRGIIGEELIAYIQLVFKEPHFAPTMNQRSVKSYVVRVEVARDNNAKTLFVINRSRIAKDKYPVIYFDSNQESSEIKKAPVTHKNELLVDAIKKDFGSEIVHIDNDKGVLSNTIQFIHPLLFGDQLKHSNPIKLYDGCYLTPLRPSYDVSKGFNPKSISPIVRTIELETARLDECQIFSFKRKKRNHTRLDKGINLSAIPKPWDVQGVVNFSWYAKYDYEYKLVDTLLSPSSQSNNSESLIEIIEEFEPVKFELIKDVEVQDLLVQEGGNILECTFNLVPRYTLSPQKIKQIKREHKKLKEIFGSSSPLTIDGVSPKCKLRCFYRKKIDSYELLACYKLFSNDRFEKMNLVKTTKAKESELRYINSNIPKASLNEISSALLNQINETHTAFIDECKVDFKESNQTTCLLDVEVTDEFLREGVMDGSKGMVASKRAGLPFITSGLTFERPLMIVNDQDLKPKGGRVHSSPTDISLADFLYFLSIVSTFESDRKFTAEFVDLLQTKSAKRIKLKSALSN